MRFLFLKALACAVVAAALSATPAEGAIVSGTVSSGDGTQLFSFSGTDGGATGSALMSVTVTSAGGQTTVVAKIWNTSPTTYLDASSQLQTNVAAITGYGFDVTDNLTWSSYSLVAGQFSGTSLSDFVLASSADPSANLWNLLADGGSGNINLDVFADNGGGISHALYNPLLAGDDALGNTSPFFTEATLTVSFDDPDVAVKWAFSDEAGIEGNGSYVALFVRMQRVGSGSLKLESEPLLEGDLPAMPEPSSLAIWLAGAAALAGLYRCRRKRAAA